MSGPYLGKNWGRKIVVASAVSAGMLGADGARRYHVTPRQLCGIPPADYQPPQPKPVVAPVLGISTKGVVLAPPATAAMALAIPGDEPAAQRAGQVFSVHPDCAGDRPLLDLADRALYPGRWSLAAEP